MVDKKINLPLSYQQKGMSQRGFDVESYHNNKPSANPDVSSTQRHKGAKTQRDLAISLKSLTNPYFKYFLSVFTPLRLCVKQREIAVGETG
jgi:hypothetical protein